ncbi:MAG TPA: TetR family transcriptional regulator C-terminal domain-containing protein [Gemmatimonadaceae bacterium]|nr:TetR family transcriptional regulator C-terminal domain-containing protein [Gemmatimonadaceae bacterium]
MIGPSGLPSDENLHATKRRLLDVGLATLLERGYNATGIQDLLVATSVPKGSFYHHFGSKEDFALQVIDRYVAEVHMLLDQALGDPDRAPLERVRLFFERMLAMYGSQGYLGSLIGLLGQELAAVSTSFRRRIEAAFDGIARRLGETLEEARRRGEIPSDHDPVQTATLMLDCWEGAAMRSRLLRSAAPLEAALDAAFRGALA